jgi:hypothetical protein
MKKVRLKLHNNLYVASYFLLNIANDANAGRATRCSDLSGSMYVNKLALRFGFWNGLAGIP